MPSYRVAPVAEVIWCIDQLKKKILLYNNSLKVPKKYTEVTSQLGPEASQSLGNVSLETLSEIGGQEIKKGPQRGKSVYPQLDKTGYICRMIWAKRNDRRNDSNIVYDLILFFPEKVNEAVRWHVDFYLFVVPCRCPEWRNIWWRSRRDGDCEGYWHVFHVWASFGSYFWSGKIEQFTFSY